MSKRKENQHNPLYPDRIESNAKGVLVAVISVIVAIILLAVIVVNFSYASGRRRSSGTDSYEEEMNQADTAVEEDIAEPEETVDMEEASGVDLSSVDIDAVSDSYATFTGILTGSTDTYAVILEGAYTIYAYNDAGEPVVMDDVNQIILIETGDADLAGYVGEEVTVGGYLEIADQDMTMVLQSFEAPEIEEAEPEESVLEEDTSLHSYQIVIADCTWAEAMQQAQEMGGYLVRINSQEEYDAIIALLEAGDYAKYHFYLGGRRDSDGTDYYWVDTDNFFVGECLNDSASWAQSAWYNGEPSYADGENGEIVENAMNLFCVGGTWYLNDSSMDLVSNYPDYLTGKVGYIVEIE